MRLTVRQVGSVLVKDFCPRCFWLRENVRPRGAHPLFSPLSGVVSSLDSHTKQVFLFWLKTGDLPAKLLEMLQDAGMIPPFRAESGRRWKAELNGILVSGSPDFLLHDADGRLFILDFKTAKWNENQERLWPLYEGQVNGYAWLARRKGHKVAGVGLVYMEIQKFDEDERLQNLHRVHQDMFVVFRPRVKSARLYADETMADLIRKAAEILQQPSPPKGRPDCPGCQAFDEWKERLP